MLHGNPSWSYYWRKLVSGCRPLPLHRPRSRRHGPVDKPGDADYDTPWPRASTIWPRCWHLGIDGKLSWRCDWSGMIGFGWACVIPRIARLVVLNTAAFPLPAEKPCPGN